MLSILFLVLSLSGIAGVWILRGQASRLVNGLFDAAGSGAAASLAKIDEMTVRRKELRAGLDQLSSEIETLGTKVNDTPVVFQGIDRALDGRLFPALQKLDRSGRQLYREVTGLSAAVKALNSTILFRDRDGALDELSATLDGLLDGFQQMDQDFQLLETQLRERKADTVQALVVSGQSLLDPLYSRLSESEARLTGLAGKVKQLQARLEAARANVLYAINLVAGILIAALAWLAISQVLAARYAWDVYRSGSGRGSVEEQVEAAPDSAAQ